MTLTEHYTAFKTRLAGGILTGKVFDTVRMNGTQPVQDNYAILYPVSPNVVETRYMEVADVSSSARYRFDVRYVATSVAGVLLWQEAGRSRVLGWRLSVAGRSCGPIRVVDGVEEGQYQYDRTTGLFYVDDTYEFMSWEV